MNPSYNSAGIINHHQTIQMNRLNTPYSNGKHFVHKLLLMYSVHVTVLMNSSITYQKLEEDPRMLIPRKMMMSMKKIMSKMKRMMILMIIKKKKRMIVTSSRSMKMKMKMRKMKMKNMITQK